MNKNILALSLATVLSSQGFAAVKGDTISSHFSTDQYITTIDTKPIKTYAPALASIALKIPSQGMVTECLPIWAIAYDDRDKAFKVVEDTEIKFVKNEEDSFFLDSRCQKSAKSVMISKDSISTEFYFSTKKAGANAIHLSVGGVGNLQNTITVSAKAAQEMTFQSIPSQEKSGLSISQPIIVSPVDEFGNLAELKEKVKLSFFTDSDCATPISGKVKGDLTQDIKKGQAVFSGLTFNVEGYVYAKAEVTGMSPVCSGYMSFEK